MKAFQRYIFVLCAMLMATPCGATDTLAIGLPADGPKMLVENQWRGLIPYLDKHFKEYLHDDRFVLKVLDFAELKDAIRQRQIDFVITSPTNDVMLDDMEPKVSWDTIWRSYKLPISGLALCLFLILSLLGALAVYIRKLIYARRQIVKGAKRLEHERAQLQALFRALPDMVWMKDPEGVYLTCNPQFAQVFGITAQQIIGKRDADLANAELAEFSRKQEQVLIQDEPSLERKNKFTHKNSVDTEVYEASTTGVWDDGGNFLGMLGIARSITEREQQQLDLIESEERFRKLFEDTMEAAMILENGRFIDANKATLDLFKVKSVEEFCQRSPWEFSPEHQADGLLSRAKAMAMIQYAFDHGAHFFEWTHARADGECFAAEVLLTRIVQKDRKLIYAVVRDISARVSAEQALRKDTELRQQIIESIPGIFYMVDNNGGMRTWNSNLETVSGYKHKEIARMHALEFFMPEDRPDVAATIAQVFMQGDGHVEARWQAKDGTVAPYYLTGARIEFDGEPLLIGIGTDMSERELILEQLSNERRRLGEIIEGTHAGTWEWNLQTGECFFNERWAEIFGYQLAELEPFDVETWINFTHPDDLIKSNRLLEKHFAGESDYYEAEIRMKHKDGSWVWISDCGRLISRTAGGAPLLMSGTHMDITVRKKAEEELRLSEQRFRNMAENSSDWLWACDLEGRHTYSNQTGRRLFGDEFSRLCRIDPLTLIHTDDVSLFCSTLEWAVREKSSWKNVVIRWKNQEGRYISLESNGTPIMDADGNVMGFQGVDRDITERLAVEQALRESKFFLKQSQQIGKLGGWRADPRKNSLMWTEGVYPIFNLPEDYQPDLKSGLRFFPPGSLERVELNLKRTLETGVPFVIETELVTSDGQQKWVELRGFPYYQHERIDYLMGTIQDITERKRAVEDLQKLWQAVEQSPNSIIITNLAAEIEYVNQRYQEVSGYTREEVMGRNPRIVQSGLTEKNTYTELWAAIHIGRTWKGEFFNRRKDGTEYIEYATISPVRQANGEITHYLSIQEDITVKKRLAGELDAHRHHLEELVESRTAELNQARELAEAANRSKSTFLANMSHEIRTPMNAIIGMTHLLAGEIDDPRQLQRLHKVGASANHLLGILNDVLDLSKIEANHMVLDEARFNVAATIDQVWSMMQDRAEAKGIGLLKEIDADLLNLQLLGDPLRIGQVLINYAGNALKFTEQGSIILRAKREQESEEQVTIRFEVEDTGIGMTEEQLQRVFNPFEQGQTSTTRQYGGTGLGLTICRHLARLMGGNVGVRSKAGEGSAFWFVVGLKRGVNPQALESKPPATDFRRDSVILLVEDNKINQEVAQQLLETAGLRVDIAGNGSEAVEKIKTGNYDLILMDMQMPVMDGLQATGLIRQLPDCRELPIIAMTANVFDEDRKRCLSAGMNDFLPKPFDPEKLYEMLRQWLPTLPVAGDTADISFRDSVEDFAQNQAMDAAANESLAMISAQLRGQFAELEELLTTDNIRAVEAWGSISPQLANAVSSKQLAHLARKIEVYDFPAALEIWHSLLKAYPHLQFNPAGGSFGRQNPL